MTQIWPLFLKKTGLKESDFQTVAGDGQTKLNAVINGQADLLLGYVMDQSMKIKDATGKDVNAIKFADYGINMVCSGIVANTEFVKANADLVKRFMSATTKAVEAAEKDAKGAAQSILDANPKGGKIETLTQGFELTIPLYRTPETKNKRPFQVTDQNMTDTVNLMVEYGGLDAKAKDNPEGVLHQRLPAAGRFVSGLDDHLHRRPRARGRTHSHRPAVVAEGLSPPCSERKGTAYGSLRSQGRRVERSLC